MQVVCGNRKVEQFMFSNQGGPGKFRIIPSSFWPDSFPEAPHDMARVGPFEVCATTASWLALHVWPLFFDMARGDEVVINVGFEPHQMGTARERLVLVCDNCQVRDFTIQGLASEVDVQLEAIDGLFLSINPSTASGAAAAAAAAAATAAANSVTNSMTGSVANVPVPRVARRSTSTDQRTSMSSDHVPRASIAAAGSSAAPAPARRKSATAAVVPPEPLDRAAAEAVLDMPLWFGEVVPGSGFTKKLVVRNTTTLPFPFKWSMAAFPQTRTAKPLNQPLGVSRLPLDPLHAAVSAQRSGEPEGVQKGQVDLVALGMDDDSAFTVEPCEGVMQGGARVEFCITFLPSSIKRYLRWAQLKVDKSMQPGSLQGNTARSAAACDVSVLELGVEGVGAPLLYDLSPRRLVIPGNLTPGSECVRRVTLTNNSRAPARFKFEGQHQFLQVQPGEGSVAPLACASLFVRFLAGTTLGPVHHSLSCHVQHGLTSSLEVAAEVVAPSVELLTTRIDFGLVRLKGEEVRRIHIRNTSTTCDTHWQLEELVQPRALRSSSEHQKSSLSSAAHTPQQQSRRRGAPSSNPSTQLHPPSLPTSPAPPHMKDDPTALLHPSVSFSDLQGPGPRASLDPSLSPRLRAVSNVGPGLGGQAAEAGAPRTHMSFDPPWGCLAPGQEGHVLVTCHALSDGQHHSVIKLVSGLGPDLRHGQLHCLEAFAAVVTPRAVVNRPKVDLGITFVGVTARFSFTLKNLALLPLDFAWTVQGLRGSQNAGALPESVLDAEMKIRPEAGTLAAGQELDFTVRFTPQVTGQLTLFGVCYVEGAPLPTGFQVTTTARGLDVTYDLLSPQQHERWAAAQANPRVRKKREDVDNFQGMSEYRGGAVIAGSSLLLVRTDAAHLPPEVLAKLGNSRLAQRSFIGGATAPPFRHHVAAFGEAVPLGETRSLCLVVTNQTAIATSLHTWLDSFGVDDLNRLTGHSNPTKAHGRQASKTASIGVGLGVDWEASESRGRSTLTTAASTTMASPRRSEATGAGHPRSSKCGTATAQKPPGTAVSHQAAGVTWTELGAAGRQLSADKGLAQSFNHSQASRAPRNQPFRLADTTDKSSPFRSAKGTDMMATRRLQQQAEQVLGSKGLAVSVQPPSAQLPAWSRVVLKLSAFNDMCGDYFDTLHVQVGSLPVRNFPVRIGVTGTPLVVQKERVLTRGLQQRSAQWHTDLAFGQLPAGVQLTKTFYVFNTGALDMHLSWTFMRYQDDSDCDNPSATIFNVKLQVPGVGSPAPAGLTAKLSNPLSATRAHSVTVPHLDRNSQHDPYAPSTAPHTPATPSHPQFDLQGLTPPLPGPSLASSPCPPSSLTAPDSASATQPGLTQLPVDDLQNELLAGRQLSVSRTLSRSGSRSQLRLPTALMAVPPIPLGRMSDTARVSNARGGDADGRLSGVKLVLEPHAAPDDKPFVVEPLQAVIPGGQSQRFTVTFQSTRSAPHKGFLLGKQKVFSPEQPISLKLWPTGAAGDSLGVMLSGTFHPYAGQPPAPLQPLRVDLSATSLTSCLEPDAQSELSFVCHSTQTSSAPAYNHAITLSNRHACPLMFSLSVEGPFSLLSAVASAPQDPAMYTGTTGLTTQPPAPGTATVAPRWARGQLYLPPGESVDAAVQFQPPADHQQQRDDYELNGALIVSYANGDEQRLPLTAHVLHPALALRHPQQTLGNNSQGRRQLNGDDERPQHDATEAHEQQAEHAGDPGASAPPAAPLRFGRVHVARPKPLEVTLLNTSLVDALWAATNANALDRPRYCRVEDASTAAATSEITFGAFTVQPACGFLPGRGLKLPRTQRITVTFAPTDAKEYRTTLMFNAHKGRPVVLEVVGQGSFDETEEYGGLLYQL
ncbi:hypothetical protein QJQ45_023889 [Haematococcus lacustris]|nr:hypothetical protein QJQ45_023889 [Haematococcus lacustris]